MLRLGWTPSTASNDVLVIGDVNPLCLQKEIKEELLAAMDFNTVLTSSTLVL